MNKIGCIREVQNHTVCSQDTVVIDINGREQIENNLVTTQSVSAALKAMWHKASENNVLLSGNKYNVGACRYLKKALANIEIFEKGHFRSGHINYL